MNLLRALADDEAREVIACAISGGKSVADIVRECNIPHTSAYRLVNKLKNEGLLVVERVVLSKDGKKSLLYRSSVRSVMVKFEEGRISIEVLLNHNIAEKAYRLFAEARGNEHP
jgi:predicted transcriptional regulator